MDRVNRILHNPKYRECVEKNRKYEEERIFCRHDMSHFLDVARLSWIENLERGLGIEKELIYAAALLHDCGRFRQYEDGTPHELAGAQLAEEILLDCGFEEPEREEILRAISGHREKSWHRRRACAGCFTGRIRKAGPALHARRKEPAAGRPPKRTFC